MFGAEPRPAAQPRTDSGLSPKRWRSGQDAWIEKLRGFGQIGGHLEAVEESGLDIETIPIIRSLAVAGGRITREAYRFLRGAHPPRPRRRPGAIDGLALQLHGACAAEGIDDVEGEQVELCRSILGDQNPDRARSRSPRQRHAQDRGE